MCMQTAAQTTGPGAGPQLGTCPHGLGSQKSRESQQPESGWGTGGVRQKSGRWNFGDLRVFENWGWGLPIILGYGGKVSIQWDQTGRREEESHQPWSEHHQMSQVRVGDSEKQSSPSRTWDMHRGQRLGEGPLPARCHRPWCPALGLQNRGHCWPSAAPWWLPRERR